MGGKWLRRRKIQLCRDFSGWKESTGVGVSSLRGDPSLPQSGRKGQLPKAAPSRCSQAAPTGLKTAQAPCREVTSG